jgi:hypothetical protein
MKKIGLKIRTVKICSSASSNTKISIFGGILKFHLWADFGKFGQFGQFWADFAALTVADSMPRLGLKS